MERRDRKGAQVESAQVGARQAAGVASAACGGKRSRRMVAPGRRIGGGDVSAETAAVSNAAHVGRAAEPKRRSGGPGCSRSKDSGVSRHRGVAGCPRLKGEDEAADPAAGEDLSPVEWLPDLLPTAEIPITTPLDRF